MKATEILGEGVILLEMSLTKRRAEIIFMGLEPQINEHLIKLLAFQATADMKMHWKKELRAWLLRLAGITLKPKNKPVPEKVVYDWLFDGTYGGSEVRNVTMLIAFLKEDYILRDDVNPTVVASSLEDIHKKLAQRISKNDPGLDVIEPL